MNQDQTTNDLTPQVSSEGGQVHETHSVTVERGRIVRQVVGDCSFHMPHQELVVWGMDFPRDAPDPAIAVEDPWLAPDTTHN